MTHKKLNYWIKRLLAVPFILLLLITVYFFLVQLLPNGFVAHKTLQTQQELTVLSAQSGLLYNPNVLDKALQQHIQTQYHFDLPLWQRYLSFIDNMFCFRFGQSYITGENVSTLLQQHWPISCALGLISTVLMYCIAIPWGTYLAVYPKSKFGQFSAWLLSVLHSLPLILLALLLIVVFASGSVWLWFPLQGLQSPQHAQIALWQQYIDIAWHVVLPICTTVLAGLVHLVYLNQLTLSTTMQYNFMQTAKAKGLSLKQQLFRHALPYSGLSMLSSLPSTILMAVFSGNLLVEVVFNIDGMGLLMYQAVTQCDYPVAFAVMYVYSLLWLLLNVVRDVLYHWLDPRIKFD